MCGCLLHTILGTWLAAQACALTGNQICDPLVHRLELNPLSHTSQGKRKKQNKTQHFKRKCVDSWIKSRKEAAASGKTSFSLRKSAE